MHDAGHKQLTKVLQLCKERGVDAEVVEEIRLAQQLMEAREAYCEDMSSPTTPARQAIVDLTWSHPFDEAKKEGKCKWNLTPRMMSGQLEGTFLQSVVSIARARSVLEIGMFTGYSALSCAEALPADGRVVTCEYDPYLEPIARELFSQSPHGDKIQIRVGDARDTLDQLVAEGAKFDIVFIDADKAGYVTYFKKIMDGNLLAPGGTILFDNALGAGVPYSPNPDPENKSGAAIKECNKYLKTRTDMHRILVPLRDGILMMRRMSDTMVSSE